MASLQEIKTWIDANWTDILAQIGHFLAGYSIILTVRVTGYPIWLGVVIVETWAIPKEFWYDYKFETVEERGSSLLDFLLYQAGMAIGMIIVVTHA